MTFIKIQTLEFTDELVWATGDTVVINTDKIVHIKPSTDKYRYTIRFDNQSLTISADEYQRLEALLLGTPVPETPKAAHGLPQNIVDVWEKFEADWFKQNGGIPQEPVNPTPTLPTLTQEVVTAWQEYIDLYNDDDLYEYEIRVARTEFIDAFKAFMEQNGGAK